MRYWLLLLSISLLITSLCAQEQLETMMIFDSPVTGSSPLGSLNSEISGNGDLNGDGYSDIVISGRPLNGDQWDMILHIYLGSTQPDSVADYIFEPIENYETITRYGREVAFDGDINGDGIDDLVVSDSEAGAIGQGCVYIYYGGNQLPTEPNITLDGSDYASDSWGLEFGISIDISGDLNGDGYNDLVVGSVGPSEIFYGQVDVFYGGPTFDTEADWHQQGEVSEMFGQRIAVGNFNGDDYDDLAVGYSNLTEFSIYSGSEEMDTEPSYSSGSLLCGFGKMLLNGDLNQDGCNDLCINGGMGIASLLLGSIDFSNTTIALPIQYNNGNTRSFYYSHLYENDYLTVSIPIDSTFYILNYDPQDTISVAYIFDGVNYNPNAWGEEGYFIGDYNGDGHGDILLSTRDDGGPWRFRILTSEYVSVDDEAVTPEPIVMNCFPNPSRFGTSISFSLSRPTQTEMTVYNIRGQRVRQLTSRRYFTTGEHQLYWDGIDDKGLPCASGIYFIRINTGYFEQVHKVIILK